MDGGRAGLWSRLKRFRDYMFDETVEARERMFVLMLCVFMLGTTIPVIPMLINGVEGIWLNCLLLIASVSAMLLYRRTRSIDKPALMFVSFAGLVILPAMYFTSGGMNSAMPLWFVVAAICSYLMVGESWKLTVFVVDLIVDAACMLIECLLPDTVTQISAEAGHTDIIIGYITVSILLLLIQQMHMNTEKTQRRILQAQKEELEETGRRQLEEYSNIASGAGLGMWFITLKDGEEPRMRANRKMNELLGLEPGSCTEEQTYRYWHTGITPEALPSVQASVTEMMDGRFSENTYRWRHQRKGLIWVRCGGSGQRMEDGTWVLSGYHADVTAIVKKEQADKRSLEAALEEARRANAAKTEFLSRMSHDIRTPLNGIIGLLEISEKHADDAALLEANRRKERIAADHLLSLINDVLDMSKLEDGRTELACEPVDLRQLRADVMAICAIRARENGIRPEEDDGSGLVYPNVLGSPLHIRQILMNLISNGIKYNRPGGSIFCGTELRSFDGQTVVYDFIVRDTGIGIGREFLKHLYEPFTQERSDARSRYQGTGMGMAIVKTLVDKMGGEIRVESEVGVGTCFTVTLPFRVDTEAEQRAVAQNEPDARCIDGMQLLLVEDNELNREIAQTILEDAGATVTTAVNGREGLEIYLRSRPGSFDAILMDIMMPELNGYEAAERIRSSEKPDAQTVPIIAMTANAFAEDVRRAKEAGMNDHLAKPIETDRLMYTLSHYRRAN